MKAERILRLLGLAGRPSPPDLPEPAWAEVLANQDERQAASGYWRGITVAMDRKPAASNAHAILRLVVAYIVHDRASAAVMRSREVDERAWAVQVTASQLAAQLERDLGILPRGRGLPS